MSWFVAAIGSYFGNKTKEKSSTMQSEVKQEQLDSSTDIPRNSLVWLDDGNQGSEENAAVQKELRALDPKLKTFADVTQGEEYINGQSKQPHIILIVNGKLGQQLVPRVQDHAQILVIYVYCMYKEFHEKWANGCNKVFICRRIDCSSRLCCSR